MDLSLEKQSLQCRRMIDALLSEYGYADIILQGGYIINVLTREVYLADLAMKGDYILYIGDCEKLIGEKTICYNVKNKYISPGFIDAHMHFESSMLTCTEFSKLSIPSGTTTLFADPHEIANVLGKKGINAMIEEAKHLPNRILFTVPALTPDVPGLETAGEELTSKDMEELLASDYVCGLGEMQGFSNVSAVYDHSPELIDDLLVSVQYAKRAKKTVEGNAPGLTEKELAAHIILCGNETSCHETTTKEECIEKLRNGITVFMREGSTQKNMAECIKAVTEEGVDSRKLVLATDDMVAEDLLRHGHMNEVIRKTIAQGIDPVEAIQMATINTAVHYGRKDIGVLAPGKYADVCVIDNLNEMKIDYVFINGKLAAQQNQLVVKINDYTYPDSVKNTMHCKKVTEEKLRLATSGTSVTVHGIQVIEDQNLTDVFSDTLKVTNQVIEPSIEKDVLPLISMERHGLSNRIGKTFVRGMGMKEGAIAQSIGHDTHNLLVCGANYRDMMIAANRVISMGGGIALVKQDKVVADLRLPIAGLMTDEMDGKETAQRIDLLQEKAKEELKCSIHAPFMHLSFLSLATSAKVKITDYGLIDVSNSEILPTIEEGGCNHEFRNY